MVRVGDIYHLHAVSAARQGKDAAVTIHDGYVAHITQMVKAAQVVPDAAHIRQAGRIRDIYDPYGVAAARQHVGTAVVRPEQLHCRAGSQTHIIRHEGGGDRTRLGDVGGQYPSRGAYPHHVGAAVRGAGRHHVPGPIILRRYDPQDRRGPRVRQVGHQDGVVAAAHQGKGASPLRRIDGAAAGGITLRDGTGRDGRVRICYVQYQHAVRIPGQRMGAAAVPPEHGDVPRVRLQVQHIHQRGSPRICDICHQDAGRAGRQGIGAAVRGGDRGYGGPRHKKQVPLRPDRNASHVGRFVRVGQVYDKEAGRIVCNQRVWAAGCLKDHRVVGGELGVPLHAALQRTGHPGLPGTGHVDRMDSTVPGHQGIWPASCIKDRYAVRPSQQLEAVLAAPQTGRQGGGVGVCDIHYMDAHVVVRNKDVVAATGRLERRHVDDPPHIEAALAVPQAADGNGCGRVGDIDHLQAVIAARHTIGAAAKSMEHLHLPGFIQGVEAALAVLDAGRRNRPSRVGDIHHMDAVAGHS